MFPTIPPPASRLLVFARLPEPGKVKTRLAHDLGDRLAMAFSERFFFHRTQKCVAIGVDEPALPRALIDHAVALLDSCDWVIGPAGDGGYYLIGCRAAAYDTAI